MRIRVVAIGICKDKNINALIAEYTKRCTGKIEIIECKAMQSSEQEGETLLKKAGDYHPVLMDEQGESLSSVEFSRYIYKKCSDYKGVALLIGGADGHSKALKDKVKRKISLSAMTMPHMLARLMLVEQLYRAETIFNHHPYHRD